MFRHITAIIIAMSLLAGFSPTAAASSVEEKDWGIAMGFRIARIPYKTSEKQVSDVIPLMFYDGDRFFIHGLSGGIKLYTIDTWQFNFLARYRYFDIPAEFQNLVRGNAVDIGGEVKYHFSRNLESSFEIMADRDSRFYAAFTSRYHWESGSLELMPYTTVRLKTADFNSHYFGLDGFTNPDTLTPISNRLGSGLDLTLGSELRYHVKSNLYLIGRAQLTALDKNARDSSVIDRPVYGEVYLGVAFFNDKTRKKAPSLKAKPYIRIAHGWATPSDISNVLKFKSEDDVQDNQMSSIFYGHPIADSLFGIDAIDLYITTGFVFHHSADPYTQTLQAGQGINTPELAGLGNNHCDGVNPCNITYQSQPTREYVLGIKAYYNLHWPIHWRLGFAEGLSYIETVSNIEQREMDSKGYRASNLMNYLDFTADFNLGDTFGVNAMNDLFLGMGVHHRSSIFETSSAFGRIKGGSNYTSVYLQYHF